MTKKTAKTKSSKEKKTESTEMTQQQHPNDDNNNTTDERESNSRGPYNTRRSRMEEMRKRITQGAASNTLEIPKDITEYYKGIGYKLYWANVVDAKTRAFTAERLNYFISVGGSLVTSKELKQINSPYLNGLLKFTFSNEFADEDDDVVDDRKSEFEGVRKGSSVLVKLPLEYSEVKQQMNRETVQQQLDSAKQEHKKNPDAFIKEFKHSKDNVRLRKGFYEGESYSYED